MRESDELEELPLVIELTPAPDPEELFRKLCRRPHCLFLDSALRHAQLGRYSFLAVDPFEFHRCRSDAQDGFSSLRRKLNAYASPGVDGLPPFQGGAAGLFGYELGHCFENVPRARWDEFEVPALAVGLYDLVIAFDHQQDRAWIISQGFPATNVSDRQKRARDRLDQLRRWIDAPDRGPSSVSAEDGVDRQQLAPQFETDVLPGLTSDFSRHQYGRTIERAIEYIHAGDVFQVNISQRLLHPAEDDSVALYCRLRKRNAATFAGFFDLGDFQIVSASPERFVPAHDGLVEARPIKGTRPRSRLPEADLFAGDELRASDKDQAENVMIVDLLRNDLSRVCDPDSIKVPELCQLESYEFVQHLVSAVCGRLEPERQSIELLPAAFPGGSITGAPKVRAMEIIAELEPTSRGAYCGSLGYIGFNGALDLSILIRTLTAGRGWWQIPVGGGIVAQSSPEREYEETWHKAHGMLRALS